METAGDDRYSSSKKRQAVRKTKGETKDENHFTQ
jgi:hypothetical protein